MNTDNEVRELLERMAGEADVDPVAPERVLRRAHRRLARTAALGIAGLALSTAVVIGSMSLLRPSEHSVPIAPSPTTPLVPVPQATNNGPLTVFGVVSDGIDELGLNGNPGRRLVDCGGHCTTIQDAAWSADGTRLAFAAECEGGCGSAGDPYHGIRVLDVRTGEDVLVLAGDDIESLDWSPDGSRIAYATRPAGEILIMTADGSSVNPLPGTVGADSVSWSPDGTTIAYSTQPWESAEMFVVSAGGSDIVSLGAGSHPDWSPDGSELVYRDGCDIWITSSDGLRRSRIASLPPRRGLVRPSACYPGPVAAVGPVWSPDGTQVASIIGRTIFVMNADGTDLHILTRLDWSAPGIEWRPVP